MTASPPWPLSARARRSQRSMAIAVVVALTASVHARAEPKAAVPPEAQVAGGAEAEDDRRPPNILLVLLDDVGYTGFGAYGGDTATPNIDRLGAAGVMLSRYYSLPLCGPSRASLLTGQDNHVVGLGTLSVALTDEMRELPAYSMTWPDDQKTVASRLRGAGYQTFVSGKWGVGKAGTNLPHRFGFDRSWVLDSTGASNYRAKPYLPLYTEVKWFEDGERISLPADFYSSRNIVDKMIEYVDEADPNQPFFGFLSFQAVHIPVQAPREFIDRYAASSTGAGTRCAGSGSSGSRSLVSCPRTPSSPTRPTAAASGTTSTTRRRPSGRGPCRSTPA